jgi:hypothetical protein
VLVLPKDPEPAPLRQHSRETPAQGHCHHARAAGPRRLYTRRLLWTPLHMHPLLVDFLPASLTPAYMQRVRVYARGARKPLVRVYYMHVAWQGGLRVHETARHVLSFMEDSVSLQRDGVGGFINARRGAYINALYAPGSAGLYHLI